LFNPLLKGYVLLDFKFSCPFNQWRTWYSVDTYFVRSSRFVNPRIDDAVPAPHVTPVVYTIVTHPVISHTWGKNWILITTNATYMQSFVTHSTQDAVFIKFVNWHDDHNFFYYTFIGKYTTNKKKTKYIMSINQLLKQNSYINIITKFPFHMWHPSFTLLLQIRWYIMYE
jgi:hypothetical protein